MIGSHRLPALRGVPCMCLLLGVGIAVALLASSSAWAYPAMIGRADLDGSNPDFALTSADTNWLAADDEHIYWSNPSP